MSAATSTNKMSVVIDTNVVVEFLHAQMSTPTNDQQVRAITLFRNLEVGAIEGILPEVVLHECYLVLVLRNNKLTTPEFFKVFDEMLSWPCWLMDSQEISIYGRALEYLSHSPKLEFSDAVIAARAETYGAELATFDQGLLAVYDGPVWSID